MNPDQILFETVYREKKVTLKVPVVVRDENGNPIPVRYPNIERITVLQRGRAQGILCAYKDDNGNVRVGWSEYNHNDRSNNREIGKKIALDRARGVVNTYQTQRKLEGDPRNRTSDFETLTFTVDLNAKPCIEIANAMDRFTTRANKYFKPAVAAV